MAAKYRLMVTGRGRGTRTTVVTASGLGDLKRKANMWLEYGSVVQATSPSGKVHFFTTK